MLVQTIVSGGQTGADRGGLEAALALGLAHGGWCPRGRRAEDGPIPLRYRLRETASPRYAVRTEQNVIDSDGTLLIGRGPLAGGSLLTARLTRSHHKPLLHIDLARVPAAEAVARIRDWLRSHAISVLNVAGPRESNCPGIGQEVCDLLIEVLATDERSSGPRQG